MRSLAHLPRTYTISADVFAECIRATLNYQSTPKAVEHLTPILMNDFSYSLISDAPDSYQVELEETAQQLHALNFPPEQFIKVKSAFYKYYMVKHIQAIDQITDLWREHCEVDLSWGVSHDVKRIEIYIKPKPNFIDIDELVEEAILKLIDEGKFVPYKYLRTVGRL